MVSGRDSLLKFWHLFSREDFQSTTQLREIVVRVDNHYDLQLSVASALLLSHGIFKLNISKSEEEKCLRR